jgi:hypothetical protein
MYFGYTPQTRTLVATEAVLTAIYDAAKATLRGDALAFACDMTPTEYNTLKASDPAVDIAERKGRADAEMLLASTLMRAAQMGDTQAATTILKHRFDWVAKESMDINIEQRISITDALANARNRLTLIDVTPQQTIENAPSPPSATLPPPATQPAPQPPFPPATQRTHTRTRPLPRDL